MTNGKIVVTNGRVHNALNKKIDERINSKQIPEIIDKKINDSKIKTGTVLKFYLYRDEALVKLSDDTDVKCKILHRTIGSLIDYFTPEGERIICDIEGEPCIIPMYRLDCLVAEIKDDDYLLLGYYYKDDITMHAPAQPGYYSIKGLGATNEYGINIGMGKVEINTYDGVNFVEGVTQKENTNVSYADSENTYTRDDVDDKFANYKNEVDTALQEIWDYILQETEVEDEEVEDNG